MRVLMSAAARQIRARAKRGRRGGAKRSMMPTLFEGFFSELKME
eukprot:CAMPEP_0171073752 /NCGR_PEP_ID=MMETSP0766_2-20121228/11705_1 /TAXON_ID=439317 /ORGANISM="Gambierdiscus australes, Strain CAWD 149" /LENGTH=43 /DNA_ID= /DNA_START= /DNA_END= /DNA_ORIENTATION=